jgi:transcriptional regulator with XRE-family HTH domain
MVDPENATRVMRSHFDNVSSHDFQSNIEKYCSEADIITQSHDDENANENGQLILFQSQSTPIHLKAYLACALSNLPPAERQLMFVLSDTISLVCADLGIELYEPRKQTDPVHHADIPDVDVFRTDRERVLASDLLIHLCHHASTGSGEELDFAYNALMPIILISHSETKVSRMITGIPALKVHLMYVEPENLRGQLREILHSIKPILEERKLAFSKYDVNIVGNKIRALREEQFLTREDVAMASQGLISLETLRTIEDSSDRQSNPSLLHLRTIATILKTTVADLVEPDLNERLKMMLQNTILDRSAARSGFDTKDSKRLLRRWLLRVIDELEED